MSQRTEQLRHSWESRQQELGNNERSVLFRGLPSWLNQRVHRQHMRFILASLPQTGGRLLDLGCGYGRVSSEIVRARPDITAEGIEFCEGFADQFREQVGPCAHTSVQAFEPQGEYDVMLSVTCLQYVALDELAQVLQKYWIYLKPGGRMICIEQHENWFVTARKRGHLSKMQPTGGDITYFLSGQLRQCLCSLNGAQLLAESRITGLPLGFPTMHDAVCIVKAAGD